MESTLIQQTRILKQWCVVTLVLLVHNVLLGGALQLPHLNLTREDFPKDFVFGAGSSAYQCRNIGWVSDKSNADVTADAYHKYQEDVDLMGEMGLEAYRFSISWSRLIPRIQVHITLYHLDLPQCLEDEYGGWLSPRIVDDFTQYAAACFREFGDRVSHWTTLVEPNVGALASYDSGAFPPMHCSKPFCYFNFSSVGNSTVDPYIALHNMLLAHASAAKLYREKYKAVQKGKVGINVYTFWAYPLSNSKANIRAAQRVRDFMYGWVINPVVFGDYPAVMREVVGSRLSNFTGRQSKLVKGSADFIGINHYTSCYISDNSNTDATRIPDFNADMFALFRMSREDPPTNAVTFHHSYHLTLMLIPRDYNSCWSISEMSMIIFLFMWKKTVLESQPTAQFMTQIG
ncbi:hypothetical protein LUZ61_000105 [Rhynchospora tenuis]|uniref:Uncharacterized protein n=1 Tax=Rhynchospora tenuis TaxID=198213 RepID=A0AAD6EPQ9_9POAL|nr:hypothetical protein LUZ61_000105 [Rhynchospora tenuis]